MRSHLLRGFAFVVLAASSLISMPAVIGAPTPSYEYVTMADGVKISVSVTYPSDYAAADPTSNPNNDALDPPGWPTLFQMDGYGGGGSNFSSSVNDRFAGRYVIVYASIRGTGCSGGRFDLFDRVHAEDGRTIIDQWIPEQPWFNGKVGIIGHSYPGLTGWMVASTQPKELDVIAISGLIDDLYRGIVYPGGVPNFGFPAFWTGAYRPAIEIAGNAGRLANETAAIPSGPTDPTCARHIAERTADQNTSLGALDNPIVQGLTSQEDDTWWQVRSNGSYVKLINKPIHLTQQWQDEQTGPRGANTLFERLEVPKRIVFTNGVHATTGIANADRLEWLDCWTYGNGDPLDSRCGADTLLGSSKVRIHFEQSGNSSPTNPAYISSDWPLPETDWTRLFLRDDGTLSLTEGANEGALHYVSTPGGRQISEEIGTVSNPGAPDVRTSRATFTSGPDQLRYEYSFAETRALAGPIHLTLRASSSAVDTDFFVDLLDVTPDGTTLYLQRGMLRASHRQVDPYRSDLVESGPQAGSYYRAHHPHTNTTLNLLTPLQPETLQIEIFPLGHVFRQGHSLVMLLHAPPPKDPISIYAYVSGRAPAINTVFHNGASSILLPFLPANATLPIGANTPACGSLAGVMCFRPVS